MGGAGLAAPALIWSLIRPVTFFFGAIVLFFRSNETSRPHSPAIRSDAVGGRAGTRKRPDNLSIVHAPPGVPSPHGSRRIPRRLRRRVDPADPHAGPEHPLRDRPLGRL